jgi:Protein of unknown function (DUF3592)
MPTTALLVAASLAGAALAAYGFIGVLRALRVRSWREVRAVVIERQVAATHVHIGQFHTAYYPVVRFRYETASGPKESCAFSIARNDYRSFERGAVEKVLEPYEPGCTVSAYVSPSNPSEAVLRATVSRTTWSHYVAVTSGGTLVLAACELLAHHAVP